MSNLFTQISQSCDKLTKIAQDYLNTLSFIDNETLCQAIWDWANMQVDRDEHGCIIWNGQSELAEQILDEGIPYSETPINGSIHYALGWSTVAQDANLRSLYEFIYKGAKDWGTFKCIEPLENFK